MATPIDFGILLGLAYTSFVDELHEELAARGFDDLGSAYGYVFRALASAPMRPSQLAERLGITNQGAFKVLEEMQSRGYVERAPDPDDGRATLIRLARRGRDALASARRFHRRYERRLAAEIGKNQAKELRRLLERLAKAPADPKQLRLRLP
jgi:DNA-binding MarR family transcriptional regulator